MDIKKARRILHIGQTEPLPSTTEIFNMCEASWLYKGGHEEPHALLHSGLHSDGYFNVNAVLQFPNLTAILADRLADKLRLSIDFFDIDTVVSSSYAAIVFGKAMSDVLNAMFVFTEKKEGKQTWSERFQLPDGAVVLQVEELITTLSTTREVREAMLSGKDSFRFARTGLGQKIAVVTIVHRPADLSVEYSNYEVIALIEKEVHTWQAEECPLCKKGSKPLKPKSNWALFQGFMKQES